MARGTSELRPWRRELATIAACTLGPAVVGAGLTSAAAILLGPFSLAWLVAGFMAGGAVGVLLLDKFVRRWEVRHGLPARGVHRSFALINAALACSFAREASPASWQPALWGAVVVCVFAAALLWRRERRADREHETVEARAEAEQDALLAEAGVRLRKGAGRARDQAT